MKSQPPVKLGLFTKTFLGAVGGLFLVCAVKAATEGQFQVAAGLLGVGVLPPVAVVLFMRFLNRYPVELSEQERSAMGMAAWYSLSKAYARQYPGWPTYVIKYGLGGLVIAAILIRVVDFLAAVWRSN